jgi:hypothetical protein
MARNLSKPRDVESISSDKQRGSVVLFYSLALYCVILKKMIRKEKTAIVLLGVA